MTPKPQIRPTVGSMDEIRRNLATVNAYLSVVVVADKTLAAQGAPTDAELDAQFGTPAQVGDGFYALLNGGTTP